MLHFESARRHHRFRDAFVAILAQTLIFITTVSCHRPGFATEELGIRVPEGFQVTRYSDDDLAHDIHCMTFDGSGNPVVAGTGYIKTLLDADDDGVADSARLYSDRPRSGLHGMVFDGHDLICTGDNAIMRLRDTDADGQADGEPQVWTALRNPEHGANGLIQGPDGWFYLICGNDAGVTAAHAQTAMSPILEPRSGALLRFSPSGEMSEIVAHGFRNPYDLSINRFGHIFTVDSDGERDHHLPWYAPTRLFDIATGEHHGWVNNGWTLSWSRPESFCDNVERTATYGRGSPTGVTVYRHNHFPSRYYGGVFHCCWTLGRVYFTSLQVEGAGYRGEQEVFLQTVGETGFAPVDIAIGPRGDLWIAIGGRGTQGGVFRIQHHNSTASDASMDSIADILSAPQPLAAWSRAKWVPAARTIGTSAFQEAIAGEELTVDQRIRAVEILVELFDGVSAEVLERLEESAPVELRARIAWALGRGAATEASVNALSTLSHDKEARVVRSALESWSRLVRQLPPDNPPSVQTNLLSSDRRIRAALVNWLTSAHPADLGFDADELIAARAAHRVGESRCSLTSYAISLTSPQNRQERLETLRLMQLGVGDINVSQSDDVGMVGYSTQHNVALEDSVRKQYERTLRELFASDDPEVDRESARLLAMIQARDATWPAKILAKCTDDSLVEDDIHYLMVLAHVTGPRSQQDTERTAAAIVRLHNKMIEAEKFPSRNWPRRVSDTFERLCELDPRLPQAMIAHPDFGQPQHSLFVFLLPAEYRAGAAARLLSWIHDDLVDESDWTADLVRAIAILPAEQSLELLREQWPDFRLRDAIVSVLAKRPEEVDRRRFLDSLDSARTKTIETATAALCQLTPEATPEQIAKALSVLQRHCTDMRYAKTRQGITILLEHWTGRQFTISEEGIDIDQLQSTYKPWFEWFANRYPVESARLSGLGGLAEWNDRLKEIDWKSGDVDRGKIVFERLQCATCHTGDRRLGPDLQPIARRFSREDLLASIIDPNQNVSPLYQSQRFVTASGRVFSGMVVYESPNGTLLQIGPDETVRIADDEIVETTSSPTSLMPDGLLRDATDQDLTDLYAFLWQMAQK